MNNQEAIELLENNFNPTLKQFVFTPPFTSNDLSKVHDIEKPYTNLYRIADFEIHFDDDGNCDYITYNGKAYNKWKELKLAVSN